MALSKFYGFWPAFTAFDLKLKAQDAQAKLPHTNVVPYTYVKDRISRAALTCALGQPELQVCQLGECACPFAISSTNGDPVMKFISCSSVEHQLDTDRCYSMDLHCLATRVAEPVTAADVLITNFA